MRPLGPGRYHEMRVHGVAGTAPEAMLGLSARLVAAAPQGRCGPARPLPDITVWRPPRVPRSLRAWSWSSLTSGRWYQAFYVLLLPFMLANLAGWMLLPVGRPDDAESRPRAVRLPTLLVRLTGLLITVVFVVSAQLVVADLAAFQWLVRGHGWPVWTVGLGTAATGVVFGAVVWLTRIRPRADMPFDTPWRNRADPVGRSYLDQRQHLLWDSPGINVALRRLHMAAGWATTALLASWPGLPLSGAWVSVRWAGFGFAITALAAVTLLAGWISLGAGTGAGRSMPPVALVRHLSWALAAVALALAVLWPLGIDPAGLRDRTILPALRGTGLWVALAIVVLTLALVLVGVCTRGGQPRRRIATAPAVLLLAAASGAALGAGLARQSTRLLGGGCVPPGSCFLVGDHVDWLAIGFTTVLAVMTPLLAVAWALLARRAAREGLDNPALVGLHRLTSRGARLSALLGTLGGVVAVAGVALVLVRPGLPSVADLPRSVEAVVVTLLLAPAVAAAVAVAWSLPRRLGVPADGTQPVRAAVWRIAGLLVLAGLVALVAAAVVNGWTVDVLGIPLPPRTFGEFALDVAILLPTAVLVTRLVSGLRNRAVRRGVGVLWDVGTFWPRWFHPLAPPTYSDVAVTRLTRQLDEVRADPGQRLLLAPHSQGVVIAGAAVLGARPSERLALLTYGSPWRHLYSEFFPAYVNPRATDALAERLAYGGGPPRWCNLFRTSDPIGGPVGAGVDHSPLGDPCRRGHSDYWLEPEYARAAAALRRLLYARRPGAEPLLSEPRRIPEQEPAELRDA
ncbi:hypothetical protein [Pseudonocardia acidicola]|uniref:Integral membrane protein n=1 Tax=Pseudonocardia acidicola TaxID=2724939 RepID=A0ABX1SAN5_9PSEU|nr:hypothetical protein [Pseudonocardia acidicola]NMH97882.1 hypothetical protein [Pseudonocardia acidicola]